MSTSYKEIEKSDTKYWKDKPVMKNTDRIFKTSQVRQNSEMTRICKNEWTKLPQGYTWNKIDVCDSEKMASVCDFLNIHYRRGTDSDYVIKYDSERMMWEMCNRGFYLTVNDSNNCIVGVIGGTYKTLQITDKRYTIVEPVYLCCDKRYKKTGIAKVLMDELTRQSLMIGIDKGLFCNNRIVSRPIGTIRQYSRPLNYKKLREIDYINVSGVDDDAVHRKTRINLKPNKKYVVASNTPENVELVYNLYNQYMTTFSVHAVLTIDEIQNYMFNTQYAKTLLVYDDNNTPVDFITYNTYDIHDTRNVTNTEKTDNISTANISKIKAANILMYSSNVIGAEILFINVLKQISYDKIHIVYINDMMQSNEAILSNIKNADEDTDEDEENAAYDNNIIKTGKKTFITLYNIQSDVFKQNMISWLCFN